MSTFDCLAAAADRLYARGDHDLANLLRDIKITARACVVGGQPEATLPFIESARAVAENVLAEQDQAGSVTDGCAESAGEVRVAATTDPPSLRECLRLSAEHMSKIVAAPDQQRSYEHREAAEHYLRMAHLLHEMGLKP